MNEQRYRRTYARTHELRDLSETNPMLNAIQGHECVEKMCVQVTALIQAPDHYLRIVDFTAARNLNDASTFSIKTYP